MTTNGTVTAQEPKKRPRFASGAAVRLPLSEGDWVLVRAELTYGQQRRLAAAGLTGLPAALRTEGEAQGLRVDMAAYDLERLATWLMDWSLTGADGEPVAVTREAIEALHPDTAQEIQDALDAHIEAIEAKKAGASGASRPAATSPSAAPSAGAGRSS